MSTADLETPCPTCGAGATSRFCGRCGALVRRRGGATPPGAEREAAEAEAVRGGRPRWLVPALGTVLAAVVVAAVVSRPTTEDLTFVAGTSSLGIGGTGITSNIPVTDLTRRWRFARSDQESLGGVWVEHLQVAGDEVHLAVDGEVVTLDRATGEVAWRLPGVLGAVGGDPGSSPLLAGRELATLDPRTGRLSDRVALAEPVLHEQLGVPVGDHLVVSSAPVVGFDRRTGEVRWRAEDAWLAAVEDHLGVVRGDHVRVVDLRDGETRWEVPTSASHWQEVAILDGSLIVADDVMTAYDLATGEQRWQVDDVPPRGQRRTFTVSGGLILTIVAAVPDEGGGPVGWQARDAAGRAVPVPEGIASRVDAIAYEGGRWFGAAGGDLLAVGADGSSGSGELWRRDARAHVVVAGGGLVVAGTATGLEVLDAGTGALLTGLPGRRTQEGPTHTVLGDCVVSHYPRLDAARLADGEPCWSTRPELPGPPRGAYAGEDVVVVRSDRAITAVDAGGSVVWEHDLGDRVRSEHLPVTPRWHALVDVDRFGGGPPGRRPATGPAVELVDTRTGRTVPGPTFSGVPWMAVGRSGEDGEGVVAVQVQVLEPGSERFELQLWDLPGEHRAEPEHRWSIPSSGDARPVLTPDAVLVSTSTMLTEHDLRDGAVRRRLPLDVRIGPERAIGGDVLVAAAGGRLVGLDRRDGSHRWSIDLPGRLAAAPTIAGDVVYVAASPRRVLAVRLGDGEVLARLDLDEDLTGPPAAGGRRLLVPTRRALIAFGPELPAPTSEGTVVSSPSGR